MTQHLSEQDFIKAYNEGLDDEQTGDIWHHLNSCEACLEQFALWVERQVGLWHMNPDIRPSDMFQRELMQRIQREEATRTLISFGWNGLTTAFTFMMKSISVIGSGKPSQ